MPPLPRKRAAELNPEPPIALAFESLLRGLGSKASRDGYEKDWVAFRQWLLVEKLDVLAVEADDVERYIFGLLEAGKAKATRARALSVVREVYRIFVNRRIVAANPAREAKNPKHGGTKRTPWLDEEQLGAMLSFTGETWKDRRDRMCVQLLTGIGWRRAEIARMKVEHFTGATMAGVVKGGKEASATVSPWLLAELAAWRKFSGIERGPLLPRSEKDARAVSGDIVYNIVQRVAAAVQVPLELATPHALRRSLATHADRRGVPLADIQQSLGHASRATTERYLKGSREVVHAPSDWMAELAGKKSGT